VQKSGLRAAFLSSGVCGRSGILFKWEHTHRNTAFMTSQPQLLTATCERPRKLYRYSQRHYLERALEFGEFRLRPAMLGEESAPGDHILPFGTKRATASPAYLTLSLTDTWDDKLFDIFPGADCCLVIHGAEEFGERLHRAVQRMLPSWAGIDAAVSYGRPSPLGTAFSKNKRHANEREWMFAWRPTQPAMSFHAVTVSIGSIAGIAELLAR
jgi:hypothetical protein